MSSSRSLSLGVAILAAGNSRRMGQPKLLLPWGAGTVLSRLILSWTRLLAEQIAVVSARDTHAVHAELDRLGFPQQNRIFNFEPERGMFSSIQCAARWAGWKAELTHWAIALGDQPHVKLETLQALLDFGAAYPDKICQPLRNGRPRHPVLLPKPLFAALQGCSANNLKQFLGSYANKRAGFEADDAGLDFDIDTPADYTRAWQRFLQSAD